MIAVNIHNATIHAPTPDFNYSHCPSIAWHEGQFFVVWMGGKENREGGRGQGIVYATSRDFMQWSEAETLFFPPAATCLFEPILFTQGANLFCAYAENHSDPNADVADAYLIAGNLMLSQLTPAGWGVPRVIAATDGPEGCPQGCPTVSNPPAIIPLPDGGERILFSVHYLNHGVGQSRPRSLWSDDGGATWVAGAFVPSGERKLMEGTVQPLPDGRLVMHVRNDSDFPVVWRSISTDTGATWSQAEPTGLRSWAKTSSLRHSSGRTLLLFNDDPPEFAGSRMVHDNATNALFDPASGKPLVWKLGPCVVRKNLSVAASEDGLAFTLAGRFDLESNGYGCSYPVGVEVDGKLFVVSSRRDNMHTRRPNMIRGHVIELLEQHRRS